MVNLVAIFGTLQYIYVNRQIVTNYVSIRLGKGNHKEDAVNNFVVKCKEVISGSKQ